MARGRVFIAVLATGDRIRPEIESFCASKGIANAKVTIIGGMAAGSSFVSGPVLENGRETVPIVPSEVSLPAPAEFHGSGTVFPDGDGRPRLHLHGSAGRSGFDATGCFREDAVAWLTMEVVIEELTGSGAVRRADPGLGVSPLSIERSPSVVGLRPFVHLCIGIVLHYPAVLPVALRNDEPVDREFVVAVRTAYVRTPGRCPRTEFAGDRA